MFFKTTIIVLLIMQWKSEDNTAEAQDIDSKLTELSNDIKQLAKKFERKVKTTEDTMLELRGEENFQLSILTGQQKALENKLDVVRKNQDDLNHALGQLRQNQDEMNQALSQMKLTQDEIRQVLSQMKQTRDEMKQEQSQMKPTQDEDHNKIFSILDAIQKQTCQLSVLSLKTQIFNNKRYYFSNDEPKMSWREADKFCKSHGMELVSVETQHEWNVLNPEVGKLARKLGSYPWSSGSDSAQEGKWKWTSTGTDVIFFAEEYSMDDNEYQNCLFLHTIGWGDTHCLDKAAFICEQNTSC